VLRKAPPPKIEITAEAIERVKDKVEKFQLSIEQRTAYRLEMNQDELNVMLSENLALNDLHDSMIAAQQNMESPSYTDKTATESQLINREFPELTRSSIRDIKLGLLEDALRIYALLDIHGVEVSLELEGKPFIQDGYIKLEPSGGQLGSLPMTAGTLKRLVEYIFDSPQYKEYFRLSENIQDVQITQKRLIITSR
jgi:hypothetical protein